LAKRALKRIEWAESGVLRTVEELKSVRPIIMAESDRAGIGVV